MSTPLQWVAPSKPALMIDTHDILPGSHGASDKDTSPFDDATRYNARSPQDASRASEDASSPTSFHTPTGSPSLSSLSSTGSPASTASPTTSDHSLYFSAPSSPVSPNVPAPKRARQSKSDPDYIRRPLNCYLLWKADWLAERRAWFEGVPGVGRVQNKLNSIAGHTWKYLLPLEVKKKWEAVARKAREEHKRRHPNYHFQPGPRRSSVKKRNTDGKTPKTRAQLRVTASLCATSKTLEEFQAKYKEHTDSVVVDEVDAPASTAEASAPEASLVSSGAPQPAVVQLQPAAQRAAQPFVEPVVPNTFFHMFHVDAYAPTTTNMPMVPVQAPYTVADNSLFSPAQGQLADGAHAAQFAQGDQNLLASFQPGVGWNAPAYQQPQHFTFQPPVNFGMAGGFDAQGPATWGSVPTFQANQPWVPAQAPMHAMGPPAPAFVPHYTPYPSGGSQDATLAPIGEGFSSAEPFPITWSAPYNPMGFDTVSALFDIAPTLQF